VRDKTIWRECQATNGSGAAPCRGFFETTKAEEYRRNVISAFPNSPFSWARHCAVGCQARIALDCPPVGSE
jgi:ribosomal protein L40E